MKKVLIALMFLASTLLFAQDGRTKVQFFNQTSTTLRFMLNGNPVCTGDVISQGYCTEPVNPGAYTASATNGQQTTGGQTFDIAYGETYNYTVSERESQMYNNNPALRTVADLDYHQGFTVDAPMTLTTTGPETRTTHEGRPYTQTIYRGSLPNGDSYSVAVAEYSFQVTNEDLDRAIEGFRAAFNGTVTKTFDLQVSGQPAKGAIIETQQNGRMLRFAFMVTYRGNKAFMFAFGTWLDTQGTNMEDVKTFFSSARLN
jgi:hypothetical protein